MIIYRLGHISESGRRESVPGGNLRCEVSFHKPLETKGNRPPVVIITARGRGDWWGYKCTADLNGSLNHYANAD